MYRQSDGKFTTNPKLGVPVNRSGWKTRGQGKQALRKAAAAKAAAPTPVPTGTVTVTNAPPAYAGTRVAIAVVLDGSGSMCRLQDAVNSNFVQYLQGLKAGQQPGVETRLSVATFESRGYGGLTWDLDFVDLNDVQDRSYYNYRNSGTPLRDSIADAIQHLESKRADAYLIEVVTDGEEAHSRRVSEAQLWSMLSEHTARGNWTFALMGPASARNWAERVGFQPGNVETWEQTTRGWEKSQVTRVASTASYTSNVASGQMQSSNFYGLSATPATR